MPCQIQGSSLGGFIGREKAPIFTDRTAVRQQTRACRAPGPEKPKAQPGQFHRRREIYLQHLFHCSRVNIWRRLLQSYVDVCAFRVGGERNGVSTFPGNRAQTARSFFSSRAVTTANGGKPMTDTIAQFLLIARSYHHFRTLPDKKFPGGGEKPRFPPMIRATLSLRCIHFFSFLAR